MNRFEGPKGMMNVAVTWSGHTHPMSNSYPYTQSFPTLNLSILQNMTGTFQNETVYPGS